MNGKPFLDTNVVLYAFLHDDSRSRAAEALLSAGCTLSIQVLTEFVAVARRKLNKSWKEVHRALEIIRVFCPEPVPLTIETHARALQIAERYGYSIYDALIVAAALDAGSTVLYSEDMQHCQEIGGLTIRNPFVKSPPTQ